jgi:hypothetical protein
MSSERSTTMPKKELSDGFREHLFERRLVVRRRAGRTSIRLLDSRPSAGCGRDGDGHSFKSILTAQRRRVRQLAGGSAPPGRYEVAVFVPSNATTRAATARIVGRDDPAEAIVNQSLHFDAWCRSASTN